MKAKIFFILWSLGFGIGWAQPAPSIPPTPQPTAALPEGQTIEVLASAREEAEWASFTDPTEEEERGTDPNHLEPTLRITHGGMTEQQLELVPSCFTISQDGSEDPLTKVVTHHFAIVGDVRYENVSPGSYLEMQSQFASPTPGYPDQVLYTRTLDASGPMGRLEGTSDWREFGVRLDVPATTGKLEGLHLSLHLTGPGTVHFRNLKLVQYPDAPQASSDLSVPSAPSAQQPPGTATTDLTSSLTTDYQKAQVDMALLKAQLADMSQKLNPAHPEMVALNSQIKRQQILLDALQTQINEQESHTIDWKSFLLGVTTTGLALLATTTLLFLSRRWQRHRHERELRRIASLDS
jgi:hypothetical protein